MTSLLQQSSSSLKSDDSVLNSQPQKLTSASEWAAAEKVVVASAEPSDTKWFLVCVCALTESCDTMLSESNDLFTYTKAIPWLSAAFLNLLTSVHPTEWLLEAADP